MCSTRCRIICSPRHVALTLATLLTEAQQAELKAHVGKYKSVYPGEKHERSETWKDIFTH